jgi:selenocysteine lyase/cysteine desulfurase
VVRREDPWSSCYGADAELAACARRFDVSPAWQAFVGAEPALRAFARVDMHRCTMSRVSPRRSVRRPDSTTPRRAIVTWVDPDGADLARLQAAGITASGRNGRARVAFHVFNDDDDVERAVTALGR